MSLEPYREAAGLRLNLIMVFTRAYMKQIGDFRSTVSQEVLERHPIDFTRLIGANSAYPFEDGKTPPLDDMAYDGVCRRPPPPGRRHSVARHASPEDCRRAP